MAGHHKWSNVQRQQGALNADADCGERDSKLAGETTLALKEYCVTGARKCERHRIHPISFVNLGA
jgi:hypothetical protein